ncbi:hypothetical protein INR49_004226 [Caranx melampygus]|nr:hypothetical protein INR49_004226 [Caranx melampygus]
MAGSGTKSVLFVCLGNICRSPIAEAVFRKMATDAGAVDKWRIDSAATSTYEIGNPPDHRGQACMKKHAVPMRHVARQWVIDSGATSDWNIGSSPDARGLACLRKHGIETSHRAQQGFFHVTKEDFVSFEYILCMDESNLREVMKTLKRCTNSASVAAKRFWRRTPNNNVRPKTALHESAGFTIYVLLRKSFGTAGDVFTRDVDGASVFALCRPRPSSTCFTISIIRLRSCCASLRPTAAVAGDAEGALSLQWPVSVHISSTSPIVKCLRSPFIAPME